ncbi:MAG: cation diffusion facilitator family transporter [Oscillospiraceae bacterium]
MERVVFSINRLVRVSLVSLVWNAVLFVFKLTAGIFGNSRALVSDAVHSASDVCAAVVLLIGLKFSVKEADEEHPYGHERIESVTAVLLAVLVAATGVGIGYSGVMNIVHGTYAGGTIPKLLALGAMAVSILIKEGMFRYTKRHAKAEKSDALMASAWDNRSDALASLGGLVGIVGARAGYPVLDSVAAIFISLLIIKSAVEIFIDAANKMLDKSCDKQTRARLAEFIAAQTGVGRLLDLKTRLFGNRVYADIVIETDSALSLLEAHAIAEHVHDRVEAQFPDIKHCTVHVDPARLPE